MSTPHHNRCPHRVAPLFGLLLAMPLSPLHACADWPAWQAFDQTFISPDGRVIDYSQDDLRTVSEAQAYALFFALVANQRERFEQILRWTADNLAGGDLTSRLPAWLWGRNDDGEWGVLDQTPASDADLWLAYTLVQAGRLWQEPSLHALGILLGRQILRQETRKLAGLGLSLLPAPRGFTRAPDVTRLNPSYLPPFLFQGMADADAEAAWPDLLTSSRKILRQAAQDGFVPDWMLHQPEAGLRPDTDRQTGFGAVRVYLWAALMPAQDPQKQELLNLLQPMADWIERHGYPPAHWPPGERQAAANLSFSWALLPFLQASGNTRAWREQQLRVAAVEIPAKAYYAHALRMFSSAYQENRYRFAPDGRLQPQWAGDCE